MSSCNLCAISNILSHINYLYSLVEINLTAADMCCFSPVILETFYTFLKHSASSVQMIVERLLIDWYDHSTFIQYTSVKCLFYAFKLLFCEHSKYIPQPVSIHSANDC